MHAHSLALGGGELNGDLLEILFRELHMLSASAMPLQQYQKIRSETRVVDRNGSPCLADLHSLASTSRRQAIVEKVRAWRCSTNLHDRM